MIVDDSRVRLLARHATPADLHTLRKASPQVDAHVRMALARAALARVKKNLNEEDDVPELIQSAQEAVCALAEHARQVPSGRSDTLLAIGARLLACDDDVAELAKLDDDERREWQAERDDDVLECCAQALLQLDYGARLQTLLLSYKEGRALTGAQSTGTLFRHFAERARLKPTNQASLGAWLVYQAMQTGAHKCLQVLLAMKQIKELLSLADYERIAHTVSVEYDALFEKSRNDPGRALTHLSREEYDAVRAALRGPDALAQATAALARDTEMRETEAQLSESTRQMSAARRQAVEAQRERLEKEGVAAQKRAKIEAAERRVQQAAQLADNLLEEFAQRVEAAEQQYREQRGSAEASDPDADIDDKVVPHKRGRAFLERIESEMRRTKRRYDQASHNSQTLRDALGDRLDPARYEPLLRALNDHMFHLRCEAALVQREFHSSVERARREQTVTQLSGDGQPQFELDADEVRRALDELDEDNYFC